MAQLDIRSVGVDFIGDFDAARSRPGNRQHHFHFIADRETAEGTTAKGAANWIDAGAGDARVVALQFGVALEDGDPAVSYSRNARHEGIAPCFLA